MGVMSNGIPKRVIQWKTNARANASVSILIGDCFWPSGNLIDYCE